MLGADALHVGLGEVACREGLDDCAAKRDRECRAYLSNFEVHGDASLVEGLSLLHRFAGELGSHRVEVEHETVAVAWCSASGRGEDNRAGVSFSHRVLLCVSLGLGLGLFLLATLNPWKMGSQSNTRARGISAVALTLAFEGLALVHASGFKSSAQRLRTPGGCSLFYSSRGALGGDLRDAFEAWLFG